MANNKTPKHIKLDERNHVELPLLQQLDGLGWDIIDLMDKGQKHARKPTIIPPFELRTSNFS